MNKMRRDINPLRFATFVAAVLLAFMSIATCVNATSNNNAANTHDNGFNSQIAWTNDLNAAKLQSKELKKPMFVLIHQPWCGACKSLKGQFTSTRAQSIVDLSSKFVMVNLEGTQEPSEAAYQPDGGYYPRIVFVDTEGTVRPEVVNPDRATGEYKYYYSSVESILKGMNTALQKISP